MALDAADIADFHDAQDSLRDMLGTDCHFRVPQTPAWPSGTKMNPDTGMPYDATVVRTNAEFTEIAVRVLVIQKKGSPLRPQSAAHWDELGLMSGMDIILDVSDQDWDRVNTATQFVVNALVYDIMERKPFALGNQIYRYLIYGQET